MAQAGRGKRGGKRRRERRAIGKGQAHILATFNNTMISISDTGGNVVCWSTAGGQGFKVLEKARLSPRRWLLRMSPKKRWTWA